MIQGAFQIYQQGCCLWGSQWQAPQEGVFATSPLSVRYLVCCYHKVTHTPIALASSFHLHPLQQGNMQGAALTWLCLDIPPFWAFWKAHSCGKHYACNSLPLNSRQLKCRNFANAVNFLGSGQMINPTRDSTTAVIKDSDRLVIPGSRRPAVLITTGIVFNCNLWEPVQSQWDRVRKIQVVPLAYEYERLLGWVGSVFGKKQLYGNVTPDLALGFVTRKEGSSQGNRALY